VAYVSALLFLQALASILRLYVFYYCSTIILVDEHKINQIKSNSCLYILWCSVVRRVPPHFSILPESTEVVSGGSVNLTCVAVGSPMPYVKWRLGAIDMMPDDPVPVGRSILTLTDIRESRTYTCIALSELGNIEYDAEIRVKGW